MICETGFYRGSYSIARGNWYMTEEGTDRVPGELTRCGNQFVADVKNDLKQQIPARLADAADSGINSCRTCKIRGWKYDHRI